MDAADCALSSPPYAVDNAPGRGGVEHRELARPPADRMGASLRGKQYGTTEGQLGSMREGDFAATISSPPYSSGTVHGNHNLKPEFMDMKRQGKHSQCFGEREMDNYGTTSGQLACENVPTFWEASRTIVEQVHRVLRPGGVAIFVLKAFVRKGELVDFPGQWQAMCESVGFRTVCTHRAWLVEERGTQLDTNGNPHTKRVEKISFFRRLAQSKGSPRVDFEQVVCMTKESER